ncbi:MAG TPA: SDR family oxidoreductase [Albidovulum sp.]|uniref:SDR family oxidoreductase n=1 Tax=Albidovulum sp. TaxID=1872424 RepID=UPI002C0375E8|nr:SDR family oxidoreductase [Albidovulum sp.]
MSRSTEPPVVLITGANRGLGRALAQSFATAGATVLAACRDPASATFAPGQGAIRPLPLDAGNPDSIAALALALTGQPVDILVNNAGIRGAMGGIDTLEPGDFGAVMAVNALGPLLLTRALRPNLLAGRRRVVAMISSSSGSMTEGLDPDGDYAYRASKAALNVMTLKLGYDFPDLTCLLFHPGWVRTEMGGPEATVDADTAANGLTRLILAARPQDSGTFRRWNGDPMGW